MTVAVEEAVAVAVAVVVVVVEVEAGGVLRRGALRLLHQAGRRTAYVTEEAGGVFRRGALRLLHEAGRGTAHFTEEDTRSNVEYSLLDQQESPGQRRSKSELREVELKY